MPNNPLTQQELYDYGILRILTPPTPAGTVPSAPYFPPGYFLVPPHDVDGIVAWRKFHAGYITEGLIDPDRLGTGSLGFGDLYLADDGTWKIVSGLLPPGGTTGQILAKIDGVDYNTEWIDNYTSSVKHEVKLGENMSKGTPVYVSGTTGGSGTNMIVSKASNATEMTSSKTMGLIATGGVTNDFVFVVTEGLLAGLDTSTAIAGDPVWLGPNGTLLFGLANKPVAPAHMVALGVVTRVSTNNGEIFVKVQNGFEIEELHDVLITSKANNDLLVYESATSLWKNKTISSIFGGTPLVTTPTLAQVTTAGNTTTNAITVGGLTISNGSASISKSTAGATLTLTPNASDNAIVINNSGYIKFANTIDSYIRGNASTFSILDASFVGKVSFHWGGNASYINTGGNLLIGTTTDAGYKLDVNGTARVSDTLTVSASSTNTFVLQNPNFTQSRYRFIINGDYGLQILDNQGFGIVLSNIGINLNSRSTNGNINIWSQASDITRFNLGGQDINPTIARTRTIIQPVQSTSVAFTPTSGTAIDYSFQHQVNSAFQPNSGNASFTQIELKPIFNTTGTYSGIVRGLYYNPILTSLTGADHRAIETSAGKIIHQGLTAATQTNQVYYNTTTGELTYGALPTVATPTLAQVTTAGNFTTNSVGIGLAVAPTYKLDVSGTLRVVSPSYPTTSGIVVDNDGYVVVGGITPEPGGRSLTVYGWSVFKNNVILFDELRLGDSTSDESKTYVIKSGGAIEINANIQSSNNTFDNLTLRAGATNTSAITIHGNFSSGRILFQVLGSERMRISDTGNLLIGTTTDGSHKLDVVGTARVSSTLTANSFVKSGGTSSQFLKADGSVDSNTYLTSYSETDTLASVTTRGNTTTNSITVDKLTVSTGTSKGIEFGGTKVVEAANLSSYTQLLTQPISGNKTAVLMVAPSGTEATSVLELYHSSSLSSNQRVVFKNVNGLLQLGGDVASFPIEFIGSNNAWMKIFASGNVAINSTTDAGYKLDVSGTMRSTNAAYFASSSGNVGIGTLSPTDTNSYGKALDVQSNAGAAAYFRDSDDTSKYFLSGFAGQTTNHGIIGTWGTDTLLRVFTSGNERMRIDSFGNVGIGTTAPGYKLEVAGTFRSSGAAYASGGLGVNLTGGLTSDFDVNGFAKVRLDLQVDRRIYVNDFLYIGTSTFSGYKLDVNGTARISGNTTVVGQVTATNGSDTTNLTSAGINMNRFYCYIVPLSNNSQTLFFGDVTKGVQDWAAISFKATNVELAANVGINTASPTVPLDVNGAARIQGNMNAQTYSVNGTAGWTGTITIPTNPPGQQNIAVNSGIITNVF